MLSEAIVDVVPYLDVVFSGHPGRVKPIQIFVEGYACLDELHEGDEGGMFPVCITVMLSSVVGISAVRGSRDIHLAGGTLATGIPEAFF